MVMTFNARLLSLTKRCKSSDELTNNARPKAPSTESSTNSRTTNTAEIDRTLSLQRNDAARNKRRRMEEELEYAAATIQSALSAAGRPLMSPRRARALPCGSVDMGGAVVVTSNRFDSTTENVDCAADSKTAIDDATSKADDYNLLSMDMIVGLIQSTRSYYSFSCDDTATTTTMRTHDFDNATANTSNPNDVVPPVSTDQTTSDTNNINFNEGKFNEENSEGLSSWAPSSSSRGRFNYCDKKMIDNDNRSDGQSSDMAKEESSSSSLDSLASHDGDVECKHYDGPFQVIG